MTTPEREQQRGASLFARVAAELAELDRAVYKAVSTTQTPTLDPMMKTVTDAANYSRLWLGSAGVLALVGRDRGRRAAGRAVLAIGITSAVTNLVVKSGFGRARPPRDGEDRARDARMPASSSFPSGHAAAAFAFAAAISEEYPLLAGPGYGAAVAVSYSRVHSGVHYPGDVLSGAILGSGIGTMVRVAIDRGGDHRRARRHDVSVKNHARPSGATGP